MSKHDLPNNYDGRAMYGADLPSPAALVGYQNPLTSYASLVGAMNTGFSTGIADVGAVPEAEEGFQASYVVGVQQAADTGEDVLIVVGASPARPLPHQAAMRTGNRTVGAQPKAVPFAGPMIAQRPSNPFHAPLTVSPQEYGQPRDLVLLTNRVSIGAGATSPVQITPQAPMRIEDMKVVESAAGTAITNITIGTVTLFGNTEATANGLLTSLLAPNNTLFEIFKGREIAAQTPLILTVFNPTGAAITVSPLAVATSVRGGTAGRFSGNIPVLP